MDRKVILFVDDEVKVLNSLRRGLIDEPYETLFADSGKKALEILEQKEVHILVTDMRMPEMSGLELLKIVREKYPKIVRIVLSGYTQIATLLTAINQGEIYKYITKPWQMEEEFKPAIRQAIEFYDLNNKQDAASQPAAATNG
ncbi:MAG: hypothetical protein CVV39_03020 [Planctomycetes bacterium HGW-Planctomycetes-1]|nr:MAG: hypothetical protein CVV39_03020 [Planctomycetes bacterium HGW-Planctomycetes-1]